MLHPFTLRHSVGHAEIHWFRGFPESFLDWFVARALGIMVNYVGFGETSQNDPKWSYFRLVNYYNLVGGLEHLDDFSHHIGNFIIPTDEVIFFRGVGTPPTSNLLRNIYSIHLYSMYHMYHHIPLPHISTNQCFRSISRFLWIVSNSQHFQICT